MHPLRVLHLDEARLLGLARAHVAAAAAIPFPSGDTWKGSLASALERWESARGARTSARARLAAANAAAVTAEDSARQIIRSLQRDAADAAYDVTVLPQPLAWSMLEPADQRAALDAVADATADWALPAQEKRVKALRVTSAALLEHHAARDRAEADWLEAERQAVRAEANMRRLIAASAQAVRELGSPEQVEAWLPGPA